MDAIDRQLIQRMQRDFPLVARPFAALAEQVGVTEAEVLERVARLKEAGVIREIDAVFDPQRLGWVSALVAARVAPDRLEAVAARVNEFAEVTHNYARDHAYNLWFTVIAPSTAAVDRVIAEVAETPGVERVVSLPALQRFKINVAFEA
jgi:DNA-binding Lrp family transcriptional regulator